MCVCVRERERETLTDTERERKRGREIRRQGGELTYLKWALKNEQDF